ncbi:MAG TPA: glycoside hydrolase family 3 N-terminal domain-containing protein [Mycobacteriales bacterium]|nr:glycoside hydrolase family 3 N-terminal domain-containing protein [Mycobacteriales bacterium]
MLSRALLCAAALLLPACAAPAAQPTATTAVQTPRPSPSPCTPAPLAQRAAAVIVAGMPHVTTADDVLGQQLVDLGVGGLFLSEPNVESAAQVTALVAGLRARAKRPLLVSTDEESGRIAVTRVLVGAGPSPRRLARQRTSAQVRELAARMGARLAEVGVDLDLAPVLDLDDGPSRGVIGDRSFSADPQIATDYGLAFAAGLADAGVTPTVKHFPGQGRSREDTHRTGGTVATPLDELRATDLVPFQNAIDRGVPVVMLNHLGYDALDADLPASLSPRAYALLRSMGFRGVAITDSVGMGAVNLRWDFPEAAVRAVAAGADAVLATDGNQARRMRDALMSAVRAGRIPETRLNEAAARVTALAGGDPRAMSCADLEMPRLQVPTPAGTP